MSPGNPVVELFRVLRSRWATNKKRHPSEWRFLFGVPMGIRTPVTAVKGRCPRPLDDGDCDCVRLCCGSVGGGNRDRTGDLLHAMQALSQLSYTPDRGRELYLSRRPAFYRKCASAWRTAGPRRCL